MGWAIKRSDHIMRKKVLLSVVLTLLLSFVVVNANTINAAELSVDEIIAKAYTAAYYGGDDGRSVVDMTIVDSQGRKRKRKLVMLRKDIKDNGQQKYYAYFQAPSDVREMVYVVHKNPGDNDNRWLYLPSMDLVRRIAASDKRSSFVGSHFTYEDISGRGLKQDNHELIKETDEHYVVRHTPKDKDKVEFAYYKMWIDKENFIPVESKYYDQQGEAYRAITAEEVKKIEGYPTITVMKAKNLETGGYTINRFSQNEYDLGIPDRIFTERYLRRPARRWLRR